MCSLMGEKINVTLESEPIFSGPWLTLLIQRLIKQGREGGGGGGDTDLFNSRWRVAFVNVVYESFFSVIINGYKAKLKLRVKWE